MGELVMICNSAGLALAVILKVKSALLFQLADWVEKVSKKPHARCPARQACRKLRGKNRQVLGQRGKNWTLKC